MKRIAPLIMVFFAVCVANATTYYIDYVGGNDANSGDSTGAAWKHCPAMEPFSGSYTHSSGDRFIFKGGVTWPNAALPLYVTTSGNSSNWDYYGVDQRWYSGASWTRPVFDGGGTVFTNWSAVNRDDMVWLKAVKYIEVDGLCLSNYVWRNKVPTSQSDSWGVYCDTTTNVLVTNCWMGNWVVQTNSGDAFGGVGQVSSGSITQAYCTVSGPTNIDPTYVTQAGWTGSGCGARSLSYVYGCDFIHLANGILGGAHGDYNFIHDGGQSYDGSISSANGEHENAIYDFGSGSWTGNIFSNWVSGTTAYVEPGWGGANGTEYWINNIFIDCSPNGFLIDNEQNASTDNGSVHLFNNLVKGSSYPVRILGRAGVPQFHLIHIENNLWIGTTAYNQDYTPADWLDTNNVTMTTADATTAGLTFANSYAPQSQVASLYDQGIDLSAYFTTDINQVSRPQGSAWDIGAYEYVSAPDAGGGIATTGNIFARRRYR